MSAWHARIWVCHVKPIPVGMGRNLVGRGWKDRANVRSMFSKGSKGLIKLSFGHSGYLGTGSSFRVPLRLMVKVAVYEKASGSA